MGIKRKEEPRSIDTEIISYKKGKAACSWSGYGNKPKYLSNTTSETIKNHLEKYKAIWAKKKAHKAIYIVATTVVEIITHAT